ncbi:MAG: lasso RiPP family leader peptide-containing protein [Gemmatimonadaceae bacterium]
MYEKPKVQRFGTLRELTQVGYSGACDGFSVLSNDDGTSTDGSNYNGNTGSSTCSARS